MSDVKNIEIGDQVLYYPRPSDRVAKWDKENGNPVQHVAFVAYILTTGTVNLSIIDSTGLHYPYGVTGVSVLNDPTSDQIDEGGFCVRRAAPVTIYSTEQLMEFARILRDTCAVKPPDVIARTASIDDLLVEKTWVVMGEDEARRKHAADWSEALKTAGKQTNEAP